MSFLSGLVSNLYPYKCRCKMDFKQKGFLGKEADGYVFKYRSEYRTYFEMLERTNDVGFQFLHSLEKEVIPEIQRLTCLALYLRSMNSFAAVVRLLEFGMTQESGIILRNLIETSIYLARGGVDRAWIDKYVSLSQLFELRYLEANYKEKKDRADFDPQFAADMEKKIERLRETKERLELGKLEKSVDFQIPELGKSVGMEILVDQAWRRFTNENAHPSSSSLERFLRIDKEGFLEAVVHAPYTEEIRLIGPTACTCILYSMKGLEFAFGRDRSASEALDKYLTDATRRLVPKKV